MSRSSPGPEVQIRTVKKEKKKKNAEYQRIKELKSQTTYLIDIQVPQATASFDTRSPEKGL